jgi:hypothetical protein
MERAERNAEQFFDQRGDAFLRPAVGGKTVCLGPLDQTMKQQVSLFGS